MALCTVAYQPYKGWPNNLPESRVNAASIPQGDAFYLPLAFVNSRLAGSPLKTWTRHSSQRANASTKQHDQNCGAHDQTIPDENSRGVRAQVTKQEPDRRIADDSGNNGADRQGH